MMRSLILALTFALCGCSSDPYVQYFVPWGYLLDLESSREIAQWTMAQEDHESIKDGLQALDWTLHDRTPWEAIDSARGYLAIYRKILTGWPEGDPESEAQKELIKFAHETVGPYDPKDYPRFERRWLWREMRKLTPEVDLDEFD
jgi:hypothetical protein